MKKLFLCAFTSFICFLSLAQKGSIIVNVKAIETGGDVNGAKVKVDKDFQPVINGEALIKGIKPGYYNVVVEKSGYVTYTSENKVRIVKSETVDWNVTLVPLPPNSYYVTGQVTDENRKLLNNVMVVFGSNRPIKGDKIIDTTYTNSAGIYDFSFTNNEFRADSEFSLQFFKDNYISNNTLYEDFKFDENEKRIREIQLKLDTSKINPQPPKKEKEPLIFFEGTGKATYSAGFDDQSVSFVPQAILRYNWNEKKQNFMPGVGWHIPYELKVINTFETLSGQESNVETTYTVNNIITASAKYYKSFQGLKETKGFVDLQLRYSQIKADPALSSDENQAEDSFDKLIPELVVGISLQKNKKLFIEPYLSLSYLSLRNQRFDFNYFGRADTIETDLSAAQLSVGVNVMFNLIGER